MIDWSNMGSFDATNSGFHSLPSKFILTTTEAEKHNNVYLADGSLSSQYVEPLFHAGLMEKSLERRKEIV